MSSTGVVLWVWLGEACMQWLLITAGQGWIKRQAVLRGRQARVRFRRQETRGSSEGTWRKGWHFLKERFRLRGIRSMMFFEKNPLWQETEIRASPVISPRAVSLGPLDRFLDGEVPHRPMAMSIFYTPKKTLLLETALLFFHEILIKHSAFIYSKLIIFVKFSNTSYFRFKMVDNQRAS